MAVSPTVNEHTLQRWVKSYQKQMNTVDRFVFTCCVSDGELTTLFSDETMLSKYSVELEPYLTSEDFTQIEQNFYAYNPRLFAYDLYGIPELWYLVLYANEMHSALEFNVSRVKFYKQSVLPLLNSIILLEKPRKDANEQEMTDVVVDKKIVNPDINVSLVS